jgi:hypothetical protein
MSEQPKPSEIELVSCEVCLKEVPASEAETFEAVDYVAHFCGLECYVKWTEQREADEKAPEK